MLKYETDSFFFSLACLRLGYDSHNSYKSCFCQCSRKRYQIQTVVSRLYYTLRNAYFLVSGQAGYQCTHILVLRTLQLHDASLRFQESLQTPSFCNLEGISGNGLEYQGQDDHIWIYKAFLQLLIRLQLEELPDL
jgi:hypothetical protein